jgi:hypothetical protein
LSGTVRSVMRVFATTVGVLALLCASIIPTGALASGTTPAPEAEPGFYVTPPSTEFRRIVIHVGEDGDHVVGLNIEVPRVNCQHGFYLPHFRTTSYLVPAEFIAIVNHVGRESIAVNPNPEEQPGGRLGVYVHFTTPGVVEGHLAFHFVEKDRHIGLCASTVKFKAKLKTS